MKKAVDFSTLLLSIEPSLHNDAPQGCRTVLPWIRSHKYGGFKVNSIALVEFLPEPLFLLSVMSAFVTADLHLGHSKMLSFLQPDGSPLRPFASIEEMHEIILERWNSVVRQKDTVYVLGDIAMPRAAIKLVESFNGRKILIKGNHDIYKIQDYVPIFEDVRGAYFRNGLIFTHIPVHPECLTGRYGGNVHGHLHCHQVMDNGQSDKRYFNACLERNNFTPVPLDLIKTHFEL